MRERFDNYILLSDLDGTLFDKQTKVPERNRRALQYFTENGGRFGISTGRTPGNALPLLEEIPINMPSIFLNGALLYDVQDDNDLVVYKLDKLAAEKIISTCLLKHQSIDVQVYDNRNILIVSPEETSNEEWVRLHQPCYFCKVEEINDREWTKLLLLGENVVLKALEKELKEAGILEIVDAVFSADNYLEILPKGISKGNMLQMLKAHYSEGRVICAIGDFYNDIELLEMADISAAPITGIEALKKIATYVVCSNSDGAIADFIEHL